MHQQTRQFYSKVKELGEGYPRVAWNIMLGLVFGLPIVFYDFLSAILPFLQYLTASQLLFWYAFVVIILMNFFLYFPDDQDDESVLDSKI